MTETQKKRQLRNHKLFATGLFVLMAIIFILTTVLQKQSSSHWIGYLHAFSEAAMVGALADWFAVTALFHYPLGMKIPHTNLIQNKKDQIGDNLGSFVVGNFLSPETVRPYIAKMQVSDYLGSWLLKPINQQLLISEGSIILQDLIAKLEDAAIESFLVQKTNQLTENLNLASTVGSTMEYLVEKDQHQLLVSSIASQIKKYILENEDEIRNRVRQQSYAIIPNFVDNAIADKISKGIVSYFEEIESDLQHPVREALTDKIKELSSELKTSEEWKQKIQSMKSLFLSEERLESYAKDIWKSIKTLLLKELAQSDSPLKSYLQKSIHNLAIDLTEDQKLKDKIDKWVRLTSYRYFLRNTHRVSKLISSTVENWDGQMLSEKLELEVGKDLQFIRVNGTIVGGLVGLILYTIANFFL